MQFQPSRRTYAITTFLILLVCYGYFMPKWADWGANSRADLVYAFGDKGVLYIDDYHTNTGDLACFPGPFTAATDPNDKTGGTCAGHYYTDKSLGPSLLALPFYMVFKAVAALPPVEHFIESGKGIGSFADTLNPNGQAITSPDVLQANLRQGMALAFISLFASAIPSAILGMVVFLMAARFARKDSYAFILALAYGLGTMAFPYSSVLYQHQLSSFGTFVGFFLLWRVIYEKADLRWLWVVGFLFSFVVITEYPLVPMLAIIFIWAAWKMPNRMALYRLILAGIPLGLVFMAYNYIAFHSPIPVGYQYSTNWQNEHDIGFMSLTIPSLDNIYGLTFSPIRGIFLLSPFLLLAFWGFYYMWQERKDLHDVTIVFVLVVFAFFFYNSSSAMWWGGFTVGPRYLVPMLPFLCLPIIFVLNHLLEKRWGQVLTFVLVALSVFSVWVLTIGGQAWPPVDVSPVSFESMNTSPLYQYSLPLILKGDIARNYGILVGLHGFLSLIPLLLVLALVYFVVPRWLNRRDQLVNLNSQKLEKATGGTD